MYKLLLMIIGVSFFNVFASAQQFKDMSEQIPFDKAFRKGVLPNGLTYYIRHNEKPEGRASFYIYQNAGAVLESDEQDGLAHFLEHMAFNGTTTFPGKSMLDMLESNGVKFGKDVNAYTARNETVYNISRVPTANQTLIDSCLLILRDWSNELSLDVEEIDAERGVISEEWRTRRNAGFRVRAKLGPTVYNNSIYADRDVIGELDVIKNFDPETLRAFYHDWYRTDLQAIAIVGDIDVDVVEKQVVEIFSAIPAVENPKKRELISIPDNVEPMYALVTDKENKNVSVSLMVRHPKQSDNTLASLRETYLNRFFNALMNGRYKEIIQTGKSTFFSGGSSYGNLVRGYKAFSVSATAKEGKEGKAFEAVYTELQRVINHGFTQGELDRLKTNMLVSLENGYKNRDQIGTEAYCKSIKSAYLNNISIPDADFNYQFAKEIIPAITLEEVSAIASKYLKNVNRVYTVVGPEKEGLSFVNQKEIEAIITKVEAKDIKPYVDNTPTNAKLMSSTPKGGKIVSEKQLPEFDAVEWTLSNGAKVVYRFADYQKQSVSLNGLSYGGSSVYESEDIPSLGAVSSFVKGFGIGQYSPSEYKKVMTGKTAGCSFGIGAYTESISASSTPADIESMLQLVYMRFEEPRFDEEKYNNMMKRNYDNLKRQVKTAQSIIKDTLTSIVMNGNPRAWKFDNDYLDAMSFDRMKEVYQERFSNAADFTFFIVGDIDTDKLKPMVEKYIGSINSTGLTEKWSDNGDYFPKGRNEHRISVPMTEPKGTVVLKMKTEAKYSRKTVIYHNILGSILNLRFTENIREKEGGTYGVSVRTGASRIPEMNLSMNISFDCDPEKVDHLKSLVYKELDVIKKTVLQSDLDKVVLNMKKNTEHSKKNNGYWMSALKIYYDTNENILEPGYFDEVIDQVTVKDISKAAKKFFKKADVLDIIFVPEKR